MVRQNETSRSVGWVRTSVNDGRGSHFRGNQLTNYTANQKAAFALALTIPSLSLNKSY